MYVVVCTVICVQAIPILSAPFWDSSVFHFLEFFINYMFVKLHTHLIVHIQCIICAVADLSSELLELCEYSRHHLTEAPALNSSKLNFFQLHILLYNQEIFLYTHITTVEHTKDGTYQGIPKPNSQNRSYYTTCCFIITWRMLRCWRNLCSLANTSTESKFQSQTWRLSATL